MPALKVINSGYVATLVHQGNSHRFNYISVTRPTIEHEQIDVFDSNGNPGIVTGYCKWHPIEFEVDRPNYDFVLAHTPCTIAFSIGANIFTAMDCFVRQDSVDGVILKIHTNNVRMI